MGNGGQNVKSRMTIEPVVFLASMPQLQSQMRIGTDGMRIWLDVPESELASALKLVLWRDKVLRITVEPETQ
jgi:hypothetical protein